MGRLTPLRIALLGGLWLVLLTACVEGTNRPAPGDTPDPSHGKRLFQQKGCVACHSAQAQGGLSAEAPDLRSTALSYLAVLKQVRAPKGQMAARSKAQASDEEIASIYAWLQSFPKQTPTPGGVAQVFPTPVPEPTAIATLRPAPSTTPTIAPTAPPGAPSPSPVRPTATRLPPAPTRQPVDFRLLTSAQERADLAKVAADYAKDATTTLAELKPYAAQGRAAAQDLQTDLNRIKPSASGGLENTIAELEQHVASYLRHAAAAEAATDFVAAKRSAAEMVLEGRIFVLPLAQQMIVDSGRVGVVRGRITDQQGRGIAGALVTVAYGRYKRGVAVDQNGFYAAANIPAIKPIEVKAYATGFIYHEQNTELSPGGTSTVNIVLPRQGSDAPRITVSELGVDAVAGGTRLRMKATHPRNDLAEDQLFALNPALGIGVVLLGKGGDMYETTVPFAPQGKWHFFAVDHACFSSSIAVVDVP